MVPLLRRSTHIYCNYCGTNLYDYAQRECDKCLLPFDNGYMLVEFDGPQMPRILRTYLFIKSKIIKFSNKK